MLRGAGTRAGAWSCSTKRARATCWACSCASALPRDSRRLVGPKATCGSGARSEREEPKTRNASKRELGLDQELKRFGVRIAVQGKGKIDVQNVPEGRARAQKAQAEADVAQPARARGTFAGAVPGPARVEEHRAPHADQAEGVPVGVDALLDVEHHAAVAGLVATRIPAQAGVAPEAQRCGGLEDVAGERDERQGPVVLVVVVVSYRAARRVSVERPVTSLPGDRRRAEQDPVRWKPKAVARAHGVEPEVLRRAQARQRAAQLNLRLGSHREILGSLDQVPVLDLLVVVVHELVAEKEIGRAHV